MESGWSVPSNGETEGTAAPELAGVQGKARSGIPDSLLPTLLMSQSALSLLKSLFSDWINRLSTYKASDHINLGIFFLNILIQLQCDRTCAFDTTSSEMRHHWDYINILAGKIT